MWYVNYSLIKLLTDGWSLTPTSGDGPQALDPKQSDPRPHLLGTTQHRPYPSTKVNPKLLRSPFSQRAQRPILEEAKNKPPSFGANGESSRNSSQSGFKWRQPRVEGHPPRSPAIVIKLECARGPASLHPGSLGRPAIHLGQT